MFWVWWPPVFRFNFSLSQGLSSLSEKRTQIGFYYFKIEITNANEQAATLLISLLPLCVKIGPTSTITEFVWNHEKKLSDTQKNNNIFACFNSTTYFLWYLAFFWLKNKYFSVFFFFWLKEQVWTRSYLSTSTTMNLIIIFLSKQFEIRFEKRSRIVAIYNKFLSTTNFKFIKSDKQRIWFCDEKTLWSKS